MSLNGSEILEEKPKRAKSSSPSPEKRETSPAVKEELELLNRSVELGPKADAVKEQLRDFAAAELLRTSGAVINGEEFDGAIDAHLERLKEEHPEALDTYLNALDYSQSITERIKEKEKQLRAWGKPEELTNRREQIVSRLTEMKEVEATRKELAQSFVQDLRTRLKAGVEGFRSARGAAGRITRFLRGFSHYSQPRLTKRFADSIRELEGELATIHITSQNQEQALHSKRAVEQAYADLKSDILSAFEPFSLMVEDAKEKAQTLLADLATSKSLSGLERAQNYLNQLKAQKEDYLSGVDQRQLEDELNYLTAATVNTEMDRAIEEIPKGHTIESRLQELEKRLLPYFKKEQLGKKHGRQVQEFLLKILELKRKDTETPLTDKKLLGNFIVKMRQQYAL